MNPKLDMLRMMSALVGASALFGTATGLMLFALTGEWHLGQGLSMFASVMALVHFIGFLAGDI